MSNARRKELCIPNETVRLSEVRKSITTLLAGGPFGSEQVHLITLAVDEALANIIEHGHRDQNAARRQTIEIVMDLSPQTFSIFIRDSGMPFNPDSVVSQFDLRELVRQGKGGGMGLFLIRKIMDEIHYSYREGRQNELHMVKYIDNRVPKAKSG